MPPPEVGTEAGFGHKERDTTNKKRGTARRPPRRHLGLMAKFTFIDLFSGIGGFRIALSRAGGTCAGFSEIAPDAIGAYCANFGEPASANLGDITKLRDLPRHDFLTAGVPCQSWSIAGKNLGFDDDRGQLWNDTLSLLHKAGLEAFIFENVKGLADPRNREALGYIMRRISEAGYHARKYILNACDYGTPQTRARIYIVGFRQKEYLDRFRLPGKRPGRATLGDVIGIARRGAQGKPTAKRTRRSLSCNEKGFNDYFLFNDLRGGATTIHSWDIVETTERERHICELLLRNRRKREYGALDGNPLSCRHFQDLDPSIREDELDTLARKSILKKVPYLYEADGEARHAGGDEEAVLSFLRRGLLDTGGLKNAKVFKIRKINVNDVLERLAGRGILTCREYRYDFKHGKISTGLCGINRIFLPSSKVYPTLVASDTNDFVATTGIDAETPEAYKAEFMEKVYRPRNFRRITKEEACLIQGFPPGFLLPEARPRWMRLIGNSVAVPVVEVLARAVVATGVFGEEDHAMPACAAPTGEGGVQGSLFDDFPPGRAEVRGGA